ncbi:MAG: hypothetical protein AABX10_05245 [Nanoarchaeota archaeon]
MTEARDTQNLGVNDLVRTAFGRGFKGDYHVTDMAGFTGLSRGGRLDKIMRRTWFPIPLVIEMSQIAGTFTAEDGSALEVCKKYFGQADKYASMYERAYGKKVTVTVN